MRLVLQGNSEWKDLRVARILFEKGWSWVRATREQTGALLKQMGPNSPDGRSATGGNIVALDLRADNGLYVAA
jgi:hypothetical protein